VKALCSNRDLPMLMPTGRTALRPGPDGAGRCVRSVLKGPSRPLSAMREGKLAWRFINQLSLNHLSLLDTDAEHGAAALRETAAPVRPGRRFGPALRQIDGLRSIRTEAGGAPPADGRPHRLRPRCAHRRRGRRPGLPGRQPFLLGCVLERYFARHVSMNGFTELRLRSPARGEILVGKPRSGARPML
jgi:type VI secretion system protein ImpG